MSTTAANPAARVRRAMSLPALGNGGSVPLNDNHSILSIHTTSDFDVLGRPRPPRRRSIGGSSVPAAYADSITEPYTRVMFDTRQANDHLSQRHPRPAKPDATDTTIEEHPGHWDRANVPSSPQSSYIEHALSSAKAHQAWEDRLLTPPLPEPPLPLPPGTTHVAIKPDASTMWRTKAVNAAKLDIFTTLTRRGDPKAPKTATLNIAATQRLLIAYQQRKISSLTATLYTQLLSDEATDQVLRNLLVLTHTHCDAVRDLEFMQQHAADCGDNDGDDPFYLKSSKELDRLAMEQAGFIPNHVLPAGHLPVSRDRRHPMLPGVARTAAVKANKAKHLLLRFSMASTGGLFLIVPVLVMANVPGRTSSLITTCIAMLLFAIGITLGTELKPDQVLGATAAYAAVLVVFVGTSLANTTA